MKNLIISLIILLSGFTSFSQTVDYPIIHIDSLGNTVVTMTIEQAQELDNKADLLELVQLANSKMGNNDSLCIKVINDKGIIIAKQEIYISELSELIDNKNKQIENLQKIIINYQLKEALFNTELDNKDDEIRLHIEEISRVKTKMIISSAVSSAIIVGLVTALITK